LNGITRLLYRRCAKGYGAYWKTAKDWKELARKRQAPHQKHRNFNRISERACKPDSVPHANRKRPAYAAIIPLGHGSHRDSSSLPEGFQSTMACATAEGARSFSWTLTHRAGPALPSYLALHHAGFSVPPVSPPERWALTPPFHPCQTTWAFRRRLTGFPVRCHRAPLRRRSILCGTFRSPAAPRHD